MENIYGAFRSIADTFFDRFTENMVSSMDQFQGEPGQEELSAQDPAE